MRHVFVETNWVGEYPAPAYLPRPPALELAQRAEAGDLRLYLPAICLTESQHPIRKAYESRPSADALRGYLAWASSRGEVQANDVQTVQRLLDQYESAARAELEKTRERLALLPKHPGVEVFALDEAMLARAVELSTEMLDLKPFDQAILAAVLVHAERLRAEGAEDVCFCELDWELRPWSKDGKVRQPLVGLYDAAGVWVYGDFAMQSPARNPHFPYQ
jgi:hypothetical protein